MLLVMTHAPLVLIWGAIPSAYQFGGVVATPLVLGLAGLTLMAYAVGYGGMARRIQHRGGIYAFVAHGLGPTAALATAALAVFSYIALLAALVILAAGSLTGLLQSVFDVRLPLGASALIAVAALVVAVRLRLRTLFRVLTVVGLTQAAAVIWMDLAAVGQPAGGQISFDAVDPAWLLSGSFGLALCYAVTSFVGSETGANYVDEVSEPERVIPRATLISYLITTLTLLISGWALSVAVGPQNAVSLAQGGLQSQTAGSGQPFILSVAIQLVGMAHARLAVDLLTTALILGALVSGSMSCHSVARLISGLARDGVLPAGMGVGADGRARFGAGLVAPLAAGGIALAALAGDTATATLYVAMIGGIGITAALTISSLATIVWFLRTDELDTGFLGWEGQVVAAGFAMVTTGFVFCYALYRLPDVIPHGNSYGWIFPVSIGAALLLGVVVAIALRTRDPRALSQVGRSVPVHR